MNINTPNNRMMMAPPMAQVVHTMLAQVLLVPPSLSASSRAERERGEHRNGDGSTECHSESGGNPCPKQALRQGEDEDKDRPGTRPDSDRKHHRYHFAPGDRSGKLPRID